MPLPRSHRTLIYSPLQQVLSFLDLVTASSLMKLIKGVITPKTAPKGKKKESTQAEDMEVDDDEPGETSVALCSKVTTAECAIMITNLADLFQHFGIRDQPDILRTVIETLAYITKHCTTGTPHTFSLSTAAG